jgi:hypothetical protein
MESREKEIAPGKAGTHDASLAPSPSASGSIGASDFDYNAFIIYASDDEPFIKEFLVPSLALETHRVLLCTDFTPGAPFTTEIERGVTRSAVTVAVLSPAYLRDRWARLTDEIAGYASGTDARLVPILLVQCDVPLSLKFRVMLDFRDKAQWQEEAARLRDFVHSVPAPRDSALARGDPGASSYASAPTTIGIPKFGRKFRVLAATAMSLAGCMVILSITAVRTSVERVLGFPTLLIMPDALMQHIVDPNGYPPSCVVRRRGGSDSCRPYRWCVTIERVGTFPMPKDGVFFGTPPNAAGGAGDGPASCAGVFGPTPGPTAQVTLSQRRPGSDSIYDNCGPVRCVVGPKGTTQCKLSRESCPY